jgi:zinc protease
MSFTQQQKRWSLMAAILALVIGVGLVVWNQQSRQLEQAAGLTGNGPRIQSWKTRNGARVLFVAAPQLPMVDVRIVFDAGSARDDGKPGLARLTNGMLGQGAGGWDTDTLAERFDSVGAVFSSSTARDMAILQLRSLTEPDLLETALTTLTAILSRPHFEKDDLERLRRQTLISIKNQQQSPAAIASKAFYRALYGSHPYATPVIGTADSVPGLSRQDLQAFYNRYYVGRNAVIAIVGALNNKAVRQLAERLLGELPEGEPAPELPPVKPLAAARQRVKPYPSTQTHILVGQPGMRRGDPDYFPLYVGNHILGGSGFSSRILKVIRDEHGLAYSAYSYFQPMRRKGPFIMGLQTKNGSRQQARQLLDEILRKFIEQGPTAEELDHARKNITGGFALRIDSNKDIVQYLAMIGFYDLPLDYLATFNRKVEAVTLADIKDAFARRIDPDKLLTVMVGNGLGEGDR